MKVITDTHPDVLAMVDADWTVTSNTTATYTVTNADLAKDEFVNVDITFSYAGVASGTTLTNIASIPDEDDNDEDNEDDEDIEIPGGPDGGNDPYNLSIEKHSPVFDEATYTFENEELDKDESVSVNITFSYAGVDAGTELTNTAIITGDDGDDDNDEDNEDDEEITIPEEEDDGPTRCRRGRCGGSGGGDDNGEDDNGQVLGAEDTTYVGTVSYTLPIAPNQFASEAVAELPKTGQSAMPWWLGVSTILLMALALRRSRMIMSHFKRDDEMGKVYVLHSTHGNK